MAFVRRLPICAFAALGLIAVDAFATPKQAPPPKTQAKAKAPGPVAASKGWHTPTPGKAPQTDASGRAMLVLQDLNMPDHVALTAKNDRGGFSAQDLDRAAHVLREPSTGNEHPIDPKILDLVYRVQVQFKAHEVRIISGYRTPRHGSSSNHGRGRAIDLVVPGASDEDVAKFAREQGFVGVGVYPTSGFVHLDVRDRSYFWIDTSGPGKRARTRGILADLASKSDAAATARGEKAVGPFTLATDVDSVLAPKQAAQSNWSTQEDDDVDDAAP